MVVSLPVRGRKFSSRVSLTPWLVVSPSCYFQEQPVPVAVLRVPLAEIPLRDVIPPFLLPRGLVWDLDVLACFFAAEEGRG